MRMLTNNVLVTVRKDNKEAEKVTAGGIILTGTPDEKSSKPANVIAVGPDVIGIGQGDVVYLDWATAIPVTVAGNSAAIIEDKHIKAVM
jgi:co-chaperonin GroES (HSP10)